MIDLQLPTFILDHLPTILQKESSMSSFSTLASVLVNEIWFAQTLVSIIYCIHENRLVCQEKPSNNIMINQFKFMLITNFIWYVAELLITQMSTRLVSLAIHHVVALPIFIMGLMEPQAFSIIYLSPYIWHQLYYLTISPLSKYLPAMVWISDFMPVIVGQRSENAHLVLLIYNLNLFITGLVTFYQAWKSNARVVSFTASLSAIALVFVNYGGHCFYNPTDGICSTYVYFVQ
jgi:hypothetical protein